MTKQTRCLLGNLTSVVKTWGPQNAVKRTMDFAEDYYEALGTPVALGLAIRLRYGEVADLVQKQVRPSDYNDITSFSKDYAATSLLRKCPLPAPGLDPEGTARLGFFEAEQRCAATNRRLRTMRSRPLDVSGFVHAILHTAQLEIRKILGKLDVDKIVENARFGPGSNFGLVSGRATVLDKLSNDVTVTSGLRDFAARFMQRTPGWYYQGHPSLRECHGNSVTYVPKDARTHRPIAIEPVMNTYFQLGTGKIIRQKLSRVGVRLNDQTRNQHLAEIGSSLGELATIDLSAASDTVSYELVRELLPSDWFDWLTMLRSPRGSWDTLHGRIHIQYEKFSSMGNGYTFELESLIFFALAKAVRDSMLKTKNERDVGVVAVYGDDIVVPVECVEPLEEVFTFCGFKLNLSKSFWQGPFRESCGKDYWSGTNVRPILLQELLEDAESHIKLANAVGHYARSNSAHMRCSTELLACRHRLVARLPKCVRTHLVGPPVMETQDLDNRSLSYLGVSRSKSPDLWLHEGWDASQRSGLVTYDRTLGWVWPTLRPRTSSFSRRGDDDRSLGYRLYMGRDGGIVSAQFGSNRIVVDRRLEGTDQPKADAVVTHQSMERDWTESWHW